jgi:hypothetical protein
VISFESEETTLRKLREQLHAMSDKELIAFGKYARSLAGFRISGTGDPFKVKLDEAIAEWRRRHPRLIDSTSTETMKMETSEN